MTIFPALHTVRSRVACNRWRVAESGWKWLKARDGGVTGLRRMSRTRNGLGGAHVRKFIRRTTQAAPTQRIYLRTSRHRLSPVLVFSH